jgi:hypothetical protein
MNSDLILLGTLIGYLFFGVFFARFIFFYRLKHLNLRWGKGYIPVGDRNDAKVLSFFSGLFWPGALVIFLAVLLSCCPVVTNLC